MTKRYIEITAKILLECSDDYAERLLRQTHEERCRATSAQCFRPNKRVVPFAHAREVSASEFDAAHDPNYEPQLIVVQTTREPLPTILDIEGETHVDDWHVRDSLVEAETDYARALENDQLFSATLALPVLSTDY